MTTTSIAYIKWRGNRTVIQNEEKLNEFLRTNIGVPHDIIKQYVPYYPVPKMLEDLKSLYRTFRPTDYV